MKRVIAIIISMLLILSTFPLAALGSSGVIANVALGATYTISGTNAPQGDYWKAHLTDGVASTEVEDPSSYFMHHWFSFGSDHIDENHYANVVIDLGSVYDITEVNIHFGNTGDGGISSGENQIFVSEDGENWTSYGDAFGTSDIAVGTTEWRGVAQEAVARYVKYSVNVWGSWSALFNEIKVKAYMTPHQESSKVVDDETSEDGEAFETTNVALNAPYTISGTNAPQGENFTANLTDGIASDDLGDGRWVGTWFSFGSNHKDEYNYANVVIDLGAVYDITEVKIHYGNSGDNGILSGENQIFVSEDGVNWTS